MLITEFAIACNNKGAHFFECAYYKGARRMFQIAMIVTKLIAQGIISKKISFESFFSSCSTLHVDELKQYKLEWAWQELQKTRAHTLPLDSCVLLASSTKEQDTIKNHPRNRCKNNNDYCMDDRSPSTTTACTIYNKPIQLSNITFDDFEKSSYEKAEEEADNQLELCASAIVFNMGLTYHTMQHSRTSLSSVESLKIAHDLYGLSYSTLTDDDSMLPSSNDHLCLPRYRLIFGILNNIAQIHEELGNFDSMEQCLNMISHYHDKLSTSAPLTNTSSAELTEFLKDFTDILVFAAIFEVSVASAA